MGNIAGLDVSEKRTFPDPAGILVRNPLCCPSHKVVTIPTELYLSELPDDTGWKIGRYSTFGIVCRCVVTLYIRNYFVVTLHNRNYFIATLHIRKYVIVPLRARKYFIVTLHIRKYFIVTLHIRKYFVLTLHIRKYVIVTLHNRKYFIVTLHMREYFIVTAHAEVLYRDSAHPEVLFRDTAHPEVFFCDCRCTYVLSIYRANKEDDELEYAEHQAVFRGACSFPLGLQSLRHVDKKTIL